jgi:hypothetical protein
VFIKCSAYLTNKIMPHILAGFLGFWNQTDLGSNPDFALTSCVILGNVPDLPGPLFLPLYSGDNYTHNPEVAVRMIDGTEQGFDHQEHPKYGHV